jgi:hypothetical protein
LEAFSDIAEVDDDRRKGQHSGIEGGMMDWDAVSDKLHTRS